jgi:hypothetical protein
MKVNIMYNMKTEVRISKDSIYVSISKSGHNHEFIIKYVKGDGYYACSELLEQELEVKCLKLVNTVNLGDAIIRFRGLSAILIRNNEQIYLGTGSKNLNASELILLRLSETLTNIKNSRIRKWGLMIKTALVRRAS